MLFFGGGSKVFFLMLVELKIRIFIMKKLFKIHIYSRIKPSEFFLLILRNSNFCGLNILGEERYI